MRMMMLTTALSSLLLTAPAVARDFGPRIAVVGSDRSALAERMADVLADQGFAVTRSPRRADFVIDVRVRDIRADQRVRDRDWERKRLGSRFGGRDGCNRTLEAHFERLTIEYRLDYAVDLATFGPRGERIDRDQVRERARDRYRRIENIQLINACGQVEPGRGLDRDLDRLLARSADAERNARDRVEYEMAATLVRKALSEINFGAHQPYAYDNRRNDDHNWQYSQMKSQQPDLVEKIPADVVQEEESAKPLRGNFARRSIRDEAATSR
jgi:hypothetical protein